MKIGLRVCVVLLLLGQGAVHAENKDAGIDDIRQAAEALMTGKPASKPEAPPETSKAPADTPAAATTAAKPAEPSQPKPESKVTVEKDKDGNTVTSVTIAEGDSLSAIAARLYGNADNYVLIYEANRERLHLESPDQVKAGMVLQVPPLPPEPVPAEPPATTGAQ
ncbi:MAG: LysM peptidoglycan-binding domain-containing protein [Thiothrix sp.]|uniref:LysM peptidoglycan-binding domain-containing protein n=1 Tax=Thiothrix sp. TaxID=1032 RepID=UPI002627E8E6|nr:LysM peptidoglycan-binding domain-containing protein [Thiothrix sp.]MDD5391516.1 LysM peptidoglycan-binding domain-containing protein [Thiothrix sp.]